ncbi:uncharacterized protein LOC125945324 [Dermacentor silvarum]|uniref:uncharacterized protein LOC125945324 n=1 Tax=Dermacentor silvarum TaxID=543639 RepID=UPI0021018930|nr:uncharacterized protein LOC125945324 [Dermacentor silvarum]
MMTSESTGSTTGHDDDGLSGGGDSGRGQEEIVIPVYDTLRTPSTTTADTQHITSTTAGTRHTRHTSPLTVCTVTDGPEPLYFPDDGLCDYVFFESLVLTPGSNDFSVAGQSSAVQRFVTQGQVGQKTRYGMSVSFSDAEKFGNTFRTPKAKADYESYWTFGVYDWGFLSIDELQIEAKHSVDDFAQTASLALAALKEMQEHALSKSVQRPHMFWGIYPRSEPVCAALSQSIKTTFTPTGIVVLGHLSYSDDTRSDCVIMPPVNHADPRTQKPGIAYGHSMRDAMHALECLWNHDVRTNLFLSVTMQARRYKLKSDSQGQPWIYSDCGAGQYEQRVTAQEVCDYPHSGYSTNINYDGGFLSGITYDEADGFAITFENRLSLRDKICEAWTLEATGIGVGLAVYDVNYDHRSTMCDPIWINGTWARFRSLLRLRDYLHQDEPVANILQDCFNVT